MADYDALADLEQAGLISDLPAGHDVEGHGALAARRVLSTLTKDEVGVLTSIRQRMEEEQSLEVEAHGTKTGGDGTIMW